MLLLLWGRLVAIHMSSHVAYIRLMQDLVFKGLDTRVLSHEFLGIVSLLTQVRIVFLRINLMEIGLQGTFDGKRLVYLICTGHETGSGFCCAVFKALVPLFAARGGIAFSVLGSLESLFALASGSGFCKHHVTELGDERVWVSICHVVICCCWSFMFWTQFGLIWKYIRKWVRTKPSCCCIIWPSRRET